MSKNNEYPKYVALQKKDWRYVYSFREEYNKYHVTREHMLMLGSAVRYDFMSPEEALDQMETFKNIGFLQFRSPAEVSWYATRENNTPFDEEWEVKDGFLIPVNSHSIGIITIGGYTCKLIEQRCVCDFVLNTDTWYMLGQCEKEKDFYYLRVVVGEKRYTYEFDHLPTKEEMEDTHLNHMVALDIDRHEAEVHGRIYGNADQEAIAQEILFEDATQQSTGSVKKRSR